MTRAQISALLARFPIWMRPWVWLQLMVIKRWQMRHRRELMISVCYVTGRLRVAYMADAPRDPALYHYDAPAISAWQRLAVAAPACIAVALRAVSGLFACSVRAAFGPRPASPDTS
ncbi:hypothetical protein [Hyphomonas johnsonii]|uniref:Uncharacterized protein n=1 Tax=Hyphomonas johnsonii MHS-2 TaxID=1280950 RepID=A0A059FQ03_9PROT|nr:hypothetical protein [Hyphomonas johnsonii]KCZ92702.1 hypothetical protein HJO_07102 [Hyphomonas johnsonii MHS-2]